MTYQTTQNDLNNMCFIYIQSFSSEAKANRVLPRGRTDHSKHPLPTT